MVLLAAPRKVGLGRGAGKTDIKCLILGKQSVLRSCPRSGKVTQEHRFSPHAESSWRHRDSDDSHSETNWAKGGPKVKVPSQERNVELCYLI